ncbi:MAG: hypothetical protein FWB91_07485 [Defluviitaleaceae bacterium]|nr:hypothetical protein [Defluviitaleaceae bacterium]
MFPLIEKWSKNGKLRLLEELNLNNLVMEYWNDNERKAIETAVGIISGRDAIHLDKVEILFDKYGMTFTGELCGALCSKNEMGRDWIAYKISFDDCVYHSCHELDLYSKEQKLVSSFDLVSKSDLLDSIFNKQGIGKFSNDKKYNHYILATYDYIFEIVACDFKFELD